MSEEWRPVVSYEGLYSVSNNGHVRSEDHVVMRKNGVPHTERSRLLSLSRAARKKNGTGGRVMVRLTNKAGVSRTRYVHHLVLESFVGPRPAGLCALHWDDNPDNNALENLRYGTYSENARDQIRNGGHHYARRTHCKHGHEYTPANTYWRVRGNNRSRVCRACDSRSSERSAA